MPFSDAGSIGNRGLAQDITAQDARDAAVAASLRRADVIEHILWHMRREVLATSMIQAVLQALSTAMGAQGAALIDLLAECPTEALRHHVGEGVQALLPTLWKAVPD